MLDALSSITTDPWTILAIVISAVSLVAAVYFGLKSSKSRDPKYRIRDNNVVSDFTSKVQSVEMLYRGKSISNLTVSKVLFWNGGKETIRSSDIAPKDPLRIGVEEEFEILEFGEPKTNNEPSQFKVTREDQANLLVSFEFLEKNQGAMIQVFHTGKSLGDLKMKGTVIGGHKLRLIATPASFYSKPGRLHLPAWSKLLVGMLMAFAGVAFVIWLPPLLALGPVSTTQPVTTANLSQAWPLYLFIGVVYVIMGVMTIRGYFTERLPRGLEEFKTSE